MRTIKFRGQCLGSKKWAYGDLLHLENKQLESEVRIIDWTTEPHQHIVDPKTVGQFTGLFDKNGMEIYEGDIVKSISGSLDVVSYDEIAFNLMTAYATAPNGTCVGFFGKNNPLRGIEVAGNIHDNPELLKTE